MSKPEEGNLERDYCAGVLSLRDLGKKYGKTEGAIRKQAKKNGWVRIKKNGTQVRKKGTQKKDRVPVIAPDDRASKDGAISPGGRDIDQEESFSFDPDEFGLTEKESRFVFYFLKTGNRAEAYRQAGYEGKGNTAYVEASRMYRKPKISKAIRYLKERFRKRYTADIDELVDQLMAIIRADPNDIAFYRRVNCRYCWGENHLYQWRDIAEFDKAAEAASKEGKDSPEYGGLGFVDVMDPNPDCPRCYGEGKGQMHINDTRDHEGPEKHLFAGVKLGKFGIEILTEDKKAARQLLAQLITKFDLGSNSDNVPRSLNDYYADIRKTKPESGAQGILGDAGEE